MTRALALLLSVSAASAASAAIAYSSFRHPHGSFSVEYPSDWKRTVGLQTVSLRPPGRAGDSVRLSLERRPTSKGEAQTAEAFLGELVADPLIKVVERKTVTVAGRKAERLALVETAELYGKHGQPLPGPMKEAVVVVPDGERYLVVRLSGVGAAFEKELPEFDRLVARLRLPASAK